MQFPVSLKSFQNYLTGYHIFWLSNFTSTHCIPAQNLVLFEGPCSVDTLMQLGPGEVVYDATAVATFQLHRTGRGSADISLVTAK